MPEALSTVSDQMRQGIQLIIQYRWDSTGNISQIVADTLGVERNTVTKWRKSPLFREELRKELEAYRNNFDDVQFADRKERVKALDELYRKVPDQRISLKIKLLQAIRSEVGDDKIRNLHLHKHESPEAAPQGPNIPPRAASYEEWMEQNAKEVIVSTKEEVNEPGKDDAGEDYITPNGDTAG